MATVEATHRMCEEVYASSESLGVQLTVKLFGARGYTPCAGKQATLSGMRAVGQDATDLGTEVTMTSA